MKVIDNYLNNFYLDFLLERILDRNFAWYYQKSKVVDNDNEEQFTHLFYKNNSIQTEQQNFDLLKPILDKLNVNKLLRVKLNLQIKEEKIRPTLFHTDNTIDNATTAIFYLNTNNGKTLFRDSEVESVANRIVIFPSHLEHAGTTHTDTKYRIVLNINYM